MKGITDDKRDSRLDFSVKPSVVLVLKGTCTHFEKTTLKSQ